ncbi:MAG: DUF5675 family protein [Bacteroidales bacterium]|nr:DUF5675 family protein [Bacteroidales bacterium]
MKIWIKRNRNGSAAGYTVGRLHTDEAGYVCDTLEPEDRGLHQDMSLEQIKALKVPGSTAIPKGTYLVKLLVSPSLKDKPYAKKYEGRFPCLMHVPGFDGVLIHPGITIKDTLGCILPGMNSAPGRLTASRQAYKDLMDFYIWPAYRRNENIWITIE